MPIISVNNLTFCYPNSYDNVFDNTSFNIDTDWKTGFVGRNGRGKTTFLKILSGELKYKGTISASVNFDYFPHTVNNETLSAIEIAEEINPTVLSWQLKKEFTQLNLDADVLYRPFYTLSPGERTKVLLAILFTKENNFLLIDEPTNHLDEVGRLLLSEYLSKKSGYILVSHDKRFLDSAVDHILSLNKTTIEVNKGNLSTFLQNKENQNNFELQKNQKLKKEIDRLKQSAKQAVDWSDKVELSKFKQPSSGLSVDRGFIGHKAAKMMKHAKVIEARKEQAADEKSQLLKDVEETQSLKIAPLNHFATNLISLKNLSFAYGDNLVFENFNLEVNNGDRIALKGGNGCGKSSVLKLILSYCNALKFSEDMPVFNGKISIASQLKISYVPQSAEMLSGSIWDFAAESNVDKTLLSTILSKLDFSKLQLFKDLSELSYGQKKKVLIAKSLAEKANIYIWDEPLNFIDIYSRAAIEELILEYSPTMILVEHDSAFTLSIATKICQF